MPFIPFLGTSIVGGGGPILWTPADLDVAPLAWHDFSLVSGSEGDAISPPTDISGHSNDLVDYINSNSRAHLRLSFQNGLNVGDFEVAASPSGGKGYKYPTNMFSGKTAAAIFIVTQCRADPHGTLKGFLWNMGSYNPDSTPDVIAWSGDNNSYLGFGANSRWCVDNFAESLTTWNIIYAHAVTNDGQVFVNDIQEASTGSLTVGFPSSPSIGIASSNIGANSDDYWGEVIILDYVPVTEDRNKIVGYLAHKWDTVARLDGGHPYKTDAPTVDDPETDPFFSNVVLLLSGDGNDGGTTFTDDSPSGHTVSVINSCVNKTGIQKFGSACIDCPNNAGLTYSDHADWDINPSSGSEFTVEFWTRIDTNSNNKMPIGQYAGGNGGWLFTLNGSGEMRFQYEITLGGGFQSFLTSGAGLTTGIWYHVLLNKNSSGKMRFFIDGVMKASTTGIADFPVSTAELSIGSSSGADTGNRKYDGQLDEVRITKGTCRNDSDSSFTPPTRPFPRS